MALAISYILTGRQMLPNIKRSALECRRRVSVEPRKVSTGDKRNCSYKKADTWPEKCEM